MNYFMERAMVYYFLLSEITDCECKQFRFIAAKFGVSARAAAKYSASLTNATLAELCSLETISMYKKYLVSFCKNEEEFGKNKLEAEVIEAKTLALQKTRDFFGSTFVKGNRLHALSLAYRQDCTAAVLYALQVLLLNKEERGRNFAVEILRKELEEKENSDAGLVLLSVSPEKEELLELIAATPDMLVRPEVMRSLSKRYHWEGGSGALGKKVIGF